MRNRLVGLLLLTTLAEAGEPTPASTRIGPSTSARAPRRATVISVYDGDTFTLDTGDKVRLRWVNTPERKPLEPMADEARRFTEHYVLSRSVLLQVDDADSHDGYGRLIAGATTEEGDLSLALLEAGFGHLFVIPPDDTDLTAMRAAQTRARAAKIGIWATDRYQGTLHITSFHSNAAGDDRENLNGEYLRICNIADGPVDLSGYALSDAAGEIFQLPKVVVPSGHTVRIHSGYGAVQADPSKQIEVYLESDFPIWNNKADRVSILDARGQVVDTLAQVSASAGW